MASRRSLWCFVVVCVAMALGRSAWAEPLGSAISYQGRLSEADAAVDGVVDLRFGLFGQAVGGMLVAPEAIRTGVTVVDGVFSVELDFGPDAFDGEERWIEVGVKDPGDPFFTPLAPRQKITVAPAAAVALKPWTIGDGQISYVGGSVGVGTALPAVTLHVLNVPLEEDALALFGEDLIVEDSDAILGLLSDRLGSAGSGIVFKEIDDTGSLFDQWSLYRGTSGAGSPLLMTYGPDANYTANPVVFGVHPDGRVSTAPRTETALFSAPNANIFGNMQIQIGLSAPIYSLQTINNSNGIAAFPLDLPAGSVITGIEAGVSDFTPDAMVEVVLVEHEFGTLLALDRASVGTTMPFMGGHTVVSNTLGSPLTVEAGVVYYLELRILGTFTTAAELVDVRVTYTTTTLD